MSKPGTHVFLASAVALVLGFLGCTNSPFCPDCAKNTAVTSLHYTVASTSTVGTAITPMPPAVQGGTPTAFAVVAGILPPGLTLDPVTGVISGTPTLPGGFALTIQAGNTSGTTSEVLTFYESAPPVPASENTTPSATPVLTLGYNSPQAFAASLNIPTQAPIVNSNAFSAAASVAARAASRDIAVKRALTAADTGTGYTYAITAGTLPPGLSLGADGAIDGTPTAPGSYNFTVTASYQGLTASEAISYQVNPTGSLTLNYPIPTMILTGSQAGTTPAPVLSNPVSGTAPTFAVTGGTLPPGVTLNANGSLSGTPSGSGAYPFTITATSGTQSSTFSVLVTVAPPPVATSLVPSASTTSFGTAVTLTPTFSGGSATVGSNGPGSSNVTGAGNSGVSIPTAAITSPTLFTLTVTNAAGATATTTCQVTPQTVLVATPSPAAPTRTVGSTTTFSTTVTGGALDTVTWSASAGTINASTGVWTAPAGATSGVTITATSVDNPAKSASTTVTVVAGATASLGASTASPLYNATNVTLTPTFSGAATAVLGTSQGGSQLSGSFNSGAAVPVQATGFITATTYWLRATDAAGDYVDSSVTVTPQTVSVAALNPGGATRTVGTSTPFSAPVTGGALGTVTWSASAGTINASTGVWTAPATANPSVTITATSVDNPAKTASTTVAVVAVATDGLVASTTTPLRGATSVTVTPTFSNAVSAVLGTSQGGSQISVAVTSGAPVPVQASGFNAATTYWLRATNAAGAYVDSSVTVTPQTVSVAALSPALPTRIVSTSTTFSTTVSGGALGTVTWTASAGSINAGTGAWTAPGTANPSVTITATSVDDPTRSASTTVTVVAGVTASLGASTTSPLRGATNVTVTPTFTNATTAVLGTSQGGSQISAAVTSGVAVPVQASGFTVATTYWLRATNATGTYVDSSLTVTPQTVNVGALSPATPTRTVSTSTTFSATVSGGALGTLTWTASAGSINASTGVWSAPAGANPSVTITATSVDDATKAASTTVTVVAAVTGSLGASTPSPLFNATNVTVTPTFTGAATMVLGTSQGGSQVSSSFTSGTPIAVQASGFTAATTYWLRATNAAGAYVDASVTVTPQTVSVGALSPAAPTRTVSTSTTFSTTVSGGALGTLTWTASAGTINASTGAWSAPATANPSVTITATSVDDPTKAASTTVTVVALPTASLGASTASPLFGATTVTVTPTFTGVTAEALGTAQGGSQVSSSFTSGTPIAVQASGFTATTTYWLRATNAAGAYVDASTTVTPQTVSVGALSPATPTRLVSTSTTFSTTVSGGALGTVTWTASAGTINASTGVWSAPGTPNASVTITATSVDDPTKSASTTATVVGVPSITTFTGNPTTITAGQGTLLAFNFANGVGSIDQSVGTLLSGASGGIGSVSVSPAVTTTYTLTVTGTGTPATQSVTITVGTYVSKWLYVGNDIDASVSAFTLDDATGLLVKVGSDAPLASTPSSCRNVSCDPLARFVFAVDNVGNRVSSFKIDQTTGGLTLVGTGHATDAAPWGATVDPAGNYLYVRCDGMIDVFSIDPSSGALTATSPASYTTGSGIGDGGALTSNNGDIVVHPSGNFLFSAGQSSAQVDIFTVDPTTGALSHNYHHPIAGSTGPIGVAVDPTGAYVAVKGEVAPSYITTWAFDINAGDFTSAVPNLSGLLPGDNAYNGLCFSPTLDVLYTAFYDGGTNTTGGFPSLGAFGINLTSGILTGLGGSPYTWFTEDGFTGSDCIAVTRNGKWAYVTDYTGDQIGFGAVNTTTGVLDASATLYAVGSGPTSVAVAGVVQ